MVGGEEEEEGVMARLGRSAADGAERWTQAETQRRGLKFGSKPKLTAQQIGHDPESCLKWGEVRSPSLLFSALAAPPFTGH